MVTAVTLPFAAGACAGRPDPAKTRSIAPRTTARGVMYRNLVFYDRECQNCHLLPDVARAGSSSRAAGWAAGEAHDDERRGDDSRAVDGLFRTSHFGLVAEIRRPTYRQPISDQA